MGRKELIIQSWRSPFSLRFGEIWQYRDLLGMYIRRDIVTFYKQTILGPLWFFIQPILTTIIFMFVFGGLAGIPTDGIPQPLFYLSGVILWNYFSECLTKTSDTFISNQSVFGKVYFPRMIVPLSITITGLIKMGIQLILFAGVYVWYAFNGTSAAMNGYAWLFPVLIVMMGGLGLGFGVIISSLTTKYRDLRFLLAFGIQLWHAGYLSLICNGREVRKIHVDHPGESHYLDPGNLQIRIPRSRVIFMGGIGLQRHIYRCSAFYRNFDF